MSMHRSFVATLASRVGGSAAAVALASGQLVEHPAKPPPAGFGADGSKAVMYFNNGSSAPGCGLLSHGGTQIAPLLEPDEGSDFPQCRVLAAQFDSIGPSRTCTWFDCCSATRRRTPATATWPWSPQRPA